MDSDRLKWNRRYASESSYLGVTASLFLRQQLATIKQLSPGQRVLDVACGEGRNSIFLAQNGFLVTGVDISDVGLAKGAQLAREQGVTVDFRCIDLDGCHIAEQYDVILNCNFLLRDLIPAEVKALTAGGLLLFDTLLASPQLLSAHNPAFLLRPGELERTFSGFAGEILVSEESSAGGTATARLLFQKPPAP